MYSKLFIIDLLICAIIQANALPKPIEEGTIASTTSRSYLAPEIKAHYELVDLVGNRTPLSNDELDWIALKKIGKFLNQKIYEISIIAAAAKEADTDISISTLYFLHTISKLLIRMQEKILMLKECKVTLNPEHHVEFIDEDGHRNPMSNDEFNRIAHKRAQIILNQSVDV